MFSCAPGTFRFSKSYRTEWNRSNRFTCSVNTKQVQIRDLQRMRFGLNQASVATAVCLFTLSYLSRQIKSVQRAHSRILHVSWQWGTVQLIIHCLSQFQRVPKALSIMKCHSRLLPGPVLCIAILWCVAAHSQTVAMDTEHHTVLLQQQSNTDFHRIFRGGWSED